MLKLSNRQHVTLLDKQRQIISVNTDLIEMQRNKEQLDKQIQDEVIKYRQAVDDLNNTWTLMVVDLMDVKPSEVMPFMDNQARFHVSIDPDGNCVHDQMQQLSATPKPTLKVLPDPKVPEGELGVPGLNADDAK